MIIAATEADGASVCDIAARAGVFSQEEADCVAELWQEYLNDVNNIFVRPTK